ncbi:MAG: type II toxin-antitoxin system RelE/ParE family toxin [bacterium]
MEILYKPTFVQKFNKLDKDLQDEVLEKIELFKNINNHSSLKVHKLHGKLQNCYSFYVNYKTRIVFMWKNKKEVVLIVIGDHDIYK